MQDNQAIPLNKENFKQILSKDFALVIIISIPSAMIAEYFNVPLAWFLGPMLITSIASLTGFKTKMYFNPRRSTKPQQITNERVFCWHAFYLYSAYHAASS